MESSIEGKNPVLEALRSGRAISRVMIARDIDRKGWAKEILDLIRERSIPVEWADRKLMSRRSATGSHQGVIAFAAPKAYAEIEDILDIVERRNEKALIVVLDGIEDPQNLGAIIRNVEASGAHGVIIPKRRAAPITETVAKTSAGAVENVTVARVPNIAEAVRKLKESGVWVVGIEAGEGRSIYDVDLTLPSAIVIGGEDKGISRLVRERCEVLAAIPMFGRVSSLNASAASAIALYEAVRQRRPTPA